jgi:uncharacterized delta-60 repeat protein
MKLLLQLKKPFVNRLNLFFLILLIGSADVVGQPGSNDPSFNYATGCNNRVKSIAVQSDGKILIGGRFTSCNETIRNRIARLNTDGTLDMEFNTGTGFNDWVESIVIQSDGKILVGGNFTSFNGNERNHIARLNSDGTLDTGFNPGTGFNLVINGSAFIGSVHSISLQSDSKIILGGEFTSFNGTDRNHIIRLNADGTLDAEFNPGTGFSGFIAAYNSIVYSTAIQNDGKILVGGNFTSFNGIARNFIARLKSDGTLDSDFNPGTGFNNRVLTIAIQNDNKILVGGTFTTYNETDRNYLIRLNLDATVDTDFNFGAIGFDKWVRTIAFQNDGKIVVGGDFMSYNGIYKDRLVRLYSNGSLDEIFTSETWFNYPVLSVAIQNDGKMLIGGDFTAYEEIGRDYITRLVGGDLSTNNILQNKRKETIKIYPNPTEGIITVALSDYNKNSTLEVYSQLGVLQRNLCLESPVQQVNLEGLHAGMYIYRILQNGEVKVSGILKVK